MKDSISNEGEGSLPRVYAVILHREGCLMMEHCLLHLLASEGVDLEVVILLNSCQDGMPEVAGSSPNVHTIESDHVGFSAGNNLVVAWAVENLGEPDFFLFLNDDTEVAPGALRLLVEALETTPDAAIAGPQLRIMGARGHLNSLGLNLTEDAWGWDEGIGIAVADYGELPDGGSVLAVTGSALLMRTEVFERVSGWTEIYDYYFEDLDLCLKVRDLGYDVQFVSNALVYHQISATAVEGSESKLFFFWRNRLMLALVHWPFRLLLRVLRIAIAEEILFRRWDQSDLQRRAFWSAFRRLPGILRLRWRYRGRKLWRSDLRPKGSIPVITLPESVAPWQVEGGELEDGAGESSSMEVPESDVAELSQSDDPVGTGTDNVDGQDQAVMRLRVTELEEEVAGLRSSLEVSRAKASSLEGGLREIHGSRMWRAWLWTIAIRRLLVWPVRRRWD